MSDDPRGSPTYVSSGAFKARSIREIVELALSAGFERIELGSGTPWVPDLLRPVRETAGRPIRYLIHNYFPPHQHPFVLNLAAANEMVLTQSLQHCRTAIDLSAELGAPFFSVHAGFAFDARPEQLGGDLTRASRISLEEAHDIFVRSLRELTAHAASKGVRLAVENNVIAPFNLVNGANSLGLCATAEDLIRTYEDVGSPNLAFLIDLGHLKVTAMALRFDAHTFLDRIAAHVVAFHLSDNDGMVDRNLPFCREAWFVPRLAEFPDVTMVLEAYNLELSEIRETCRIIDRARKGADCA